MIWLLQTSKTSENNTVDVRAIFDSTTGMEVFLAILTRTMPSGANGHMGKVTFAAKGRAIRHDGNNVNDLVYEERRVIRW